MEYRRLGNTGLMISAVGLGGNTFGNHIGEADSIRVVERALELGINHIDTADIYAKSQSERFVGKAIRGRRHDIILATKVGFPTGEGPNERGLSYGRIIAACEASLRRLDTDYIDLYYFHGPDARSPLEESLRAIDDLVRQGKVRYHAVSNYPAWEVAETHWIADKRGYRPSVATQNRYNLLDRSIEAELTPFCERHGVGIIPYSPVAGGLLTGKYRQGEPIQPGVRGYNNPFFERQLTERNWNLIGQLSEFAAARDHSLGELAISWLLSRTAVASVIVGSTKPEQVEANVQAGDWALSESEQAEVRSILGGG